MEKERLPVDGDRWGKVIRSEGMMCFCSQSPGREKKVGSGQMRRRVDKELWIYLLGAGRRVVAERGHVDRAPQNLIQQPPCIVQSIQPGDRGGSFDTDATVGLAPALIECGVGCSPSLSRDPSPIAVTGTLKGRSDPPPENLLETSTANMLCRCSGRAPWSCRVGFRLPIHSHGMVTRRTRWVYT